MHEYHWRKNVTYVQAYQILSFFLLLDCALKKKRVFLGRNFKFLLKKPSFFDLSEVPRQLCSIHALNASLKCKEGVCFYITGQEQWRECNSSHLQYNSELLVLGEGVSEEESSIWKWLMICLWLVFISDPWPGEMPDQDVIRGSCFGGKKKNKWK